MQTNEQLREENRILREALTAILETSRPHTIERGSRVDWDGRTWRMDRTTEAKINAAVLLNTENK